MNLPRPKLISTPVATPGIDETWETEECDNTEDMMDIQSPVPAMSRWQGTHVYFDDSSEDEEETGTLVEPVVEVALASAMDTPTTVFVRASELSRGTDELSGAMRKMVL